MKLLSHNRGADHDQRTQELALFNPRHRQQVTRLRPGWVACPRCGPRKSGRRPRDLLCIGLDPAAYGTHSLRRTKATLIYRRTKNLRAVRLLLDHTKLESTVKYLGIEVDDALKIAEHTDV
jgi:integrase